MQVLDNSNIPYDSAPSQSVCRIMVCKLTQPDGVDKAVLKEWAKNFDVTKLTGNIQYRTSLELQR